MSVPNTAFYAMGTRCAIVLPGLEEELADEMFRHIQQEIARIEGKLSRFVEGSAMSIINTKAAVEPVGVDEEVFDILRSCASFHEKTGGCFDITLGGAQPILLDETHRTVFLLNEFVSIDLGGFGKGYALEKVNDLLDRYDVKNAFITMGESSVLTRGHHPAGDHWKVGVKCLRNPDEAMHTFEVRNGSVSTSSNIDRRHVMDPFTGIPVDALIMVSVCSGSALEAEVLSTACLVMSNDAIQETVDRFSGMIVMKADYNSNAIVKRVWESKNLE